MPLPGGSLVALRRRLSNGFALVAAREGERSCRAIVSCDTRSFLARNWMTGLTGPTV